MNLLNVDGEPSSSVKTAGTHITLEVLGLLMLH